MWDNSESSRIFNCVFFDVKFHDQSLHLNIFWGIRCYENKKKPILYFPFCRGSVIKVKVLGAVALIDEGETDWKVLAIDVEDPLAAEIDDISSLEAKMPGNDLQD